MLTLAELLFKIIFSICSRWGIPIRFSLAFSIVAYLMPNKLKTPIFWTLFLPEKVKVSTFVIFLDANEPVCAEYAADVSTVNSDSIFFSFSAIGLKLLFKYSLSILEGKGAIFCSKYFNSSILSSILAKRLCLSLNSCFLINELKVE